MIKICYGRARQGGMVSVGTTVCMCRSACRILCMRMVEKVVHALEHFVFGPNSGAYTITPRFISMVVVVCFSVKEMPESIVGSVGGRYLGSSSVNGLVGKVDSMRACTGHNSPSAHAHSLAAASSDIVPPVSRRSSGWTVPLHWTRLVVCVLIASG